MNGYVELKIIPENGRAEKRQKNPYDPTRVERNEIIEKNDDEIWIYYI